MSTKRRAPGTGTIKHLGGDRYLVRVPTADGRRPGKVIRAESPEDAAKQVDTMLAVLAGEGMAPVGGITLRGWLAEWLRRQEEKGARPGSLTTYGNRIRNCIHPAVFIDDLLQNIRPAHIRAHLRWLQSQHAKPTVSGALSVLRMALEEAVRDEIIPVNPAFGILPERSRRKKKARRAPLTREEFAAVLSGNFAPADRALILTAATGGLRAGEAFAFPLSHVRDLGGTVELHVEFGGYGGAPTKGGEERDVALFGSAADALREWLAIVPRDRARNPEGLLFPGRAGGRRVLSHASKWLRYRLRMVGINRAIRFHDLRHTAGTALQNGWLGLNLAPEHVQAVLGHASVTQTEAYTGGAAEAMLAAVRAFARQGAVAPEADPLRRIAAVRRDHGTTEISARIENSAQRRP